MLKYLFSFLFLFSSIAFAAEPYTTKLTITADGTYKFSPYSEQKPVFLFDYTAGTGTIAFTCSAKKDNFAMASATNPTSVTADAYRAPVDYCPEYILTMSSCASCNVNVYITDFKN